ncbi:UTP--glucose-1-phosphate uridylyltransferase GalU [Hirschia baltica]|uniref:UTP--glucose-1-phosphate uridylyltransferase n=1 Tax=Hirschia baltica (strain ATCC 49814 / DSM 5838 / IFAM 1418) TaxID=582402 RepID=C6XNF8_HIRBI|nr:UTP--glucose-1-phosphate uridylyltransferase GalU [Hirschia baltica]ACT60102.1 UTP-glucose-1-phosphate uridylyltransferase [Hirschia baltica ATCC 49814]
MAIKPVRKAVLPVAGFGTRVLPATKSIPKEMMPVFDRPAIDHVVREALEAGIEHIVFVTGRNKGAIEDYFDSAYELEDSLSKRSGKEAILAEVQATTLPAGSTSFTRQQTAKGLGHAVLCAKDIIGDEPFAVLLPDVLVNSKVSCLKQMMDSYNEVGGNIIAVDEVPMERVHKYGVIKPAAGADVSKKLIKMDAMVEKPATEDAPSNLKITGRYILQPEIFALLETQSAGAGNEIQLTDSMERLMAKQEFYASRFDGDDYDCGDKMLYLQAQAGYALADKEHSAQAREILEALLKKFS